MADKKPDEKDDDLIVNTGEGETIEIEVVDDTPAKDKGRKPLDRKVEDPTDEELEEYSAGAKRKIKDLTHARHDERRRAESAERERTELQQFSMRLLKERDDMTNRFNAGAVEYGRVALEGAQSALAKAKTDLKAAHEAFDTDKIVEAQEALSTATLRVEQAKSYRAPPAAPVQKATDEVQTQQPQPQRPLDAKTLSWQASNQWFGRAGNEAETSYALGLHQKLVNSGMDPRTDEYFEAIDARMSAKFPELFDEDGDEQPDPKPTKPEKKPQTVVAPATRTPAGPGKVRLTSTQVALAKRLGLSPQQYAAEVVRLQKEPANG